MQELWLDSDVYKRQGESDIVSFGFSSSLKTFEYMIEVIMSKTTHGFVYKEYAKIVTSFGF